MRSGKADEYISLFSALKNECGFLFAAAVADVRVRGETCSDNVPCIAFRSCANEVNHTDVRSNAPELDLPPRRTHTDAIELLNAECATAAHKPRLGLGEYSCRPP